MEKLTQLQLKQKKFNPLPKFPPLERDLALVVDDEIYSAEIQKLILKNGGNLIEEVELFDIYRGDPVPSGKKSLAYSIRYRSSAKTLTDPEVDEIHRRIINELKQHFKAEIRS